MIQLGPYVSGEVPSPLQVTFKDSIGAPLNLTGYTATWEYRVYGGATVTKAATIPTPASGVTQYTWVLADMLTAGDYEAEMWVTNGVNILASQRYSYRVAVSLTGIGGPPVAPPVNGHVSALVVDGAALVGGTLGVTGLASFSAGLTVSAGPITLPAGSIADAALSANVALLTGAQAFTGIKTFQTNPVFNAGAIPESAVASLVADLAAKAADNAVLHLAGAENVSGQKTFNTNPVFNAAAIPESAVASLVADLSARALDSLVLHLAGTETLTGSKIFTQTAGSNASFSARINTDTNDRIRIRADGTLYWGDGGGVLDANFHRVGAGRMQLSGSDLEVAQQLYPGDEALAPQNSGGLLHTTGTPSNANGNNGDWAIGPTNFWLKASAAWSAPFAKVQAIVAANTIYVDQSAAGNDANSGKSVGDALQTVNAAVDKLNASGSPGRIVFVRAQGGNIDASRTLNCVVGIFFQAINPWGAAIRRTFSTPNSRKVNDAVVTAAGTSVQSTTAAFTGAETGRIAEIYGAGTGGGTYYGFLTYTDATHCALDCPTALARDATTDPHGVRFRILGDWDQVVTDAGMTAGGFVVSSATAVWNIGRNVIIAGAGQNGQALCGVVKSINGTQATIDAKATNTVSNKTCAIGVNFGDLVCFHASSSGAEGIDFSDTSTGNGSLGAAVAFRAPDNGNIGFGSTFLKDCEVDSNDAAGAWEHTVDFDGSWNQNAGGGGIRSTGFINLLNFGARTPGENIRLNTVNHQWWYGGDAVESPTSIRQGVAVLDPQKNGGGRGANDATDLAFIGRNAIADLYCEGQYITVMGGRLGGNSGSGKSVWLGTTADHCMIHTVDRQTTDTTYDQGTNNDIVTQLLKPRSSERKSTIPSVLLYDNFDRRTLTTANLTPGTFASGIPFYCHIWLPGGLKVSKVIIAGGSTALAWGSGWTGPHFRIGLMDPDGNLLGESADTGGTQVFSNATIGTPISLAAPVIVPRSGVCYVGILINSGTGGSAFVMPTFSGCSIANIGNVGTVLLGIVTGSGLTDLPGSISVTANGVSTSIYCGVA